MTSILALQIDSREDTWLKNWQTTPPALLADVPILVQALETGDAKVICADGVVLNVERKTPSDFLNSIPNDHIFDQVARMMQERRESGALPFLVITGEIMRNPSTGNCIIPGSKHGEGWNWNAIQGALLSIQEAGVPVIFCAGDLDYAACLDRLAKRNHSHMIINPTREIMALTPEERVLCGLDGIGPELATAILDRCTFPAWALDVLTDTRVDAPKIPGIADGRKRIIRKVLGLQDDQKLSVTAV
jgi:ERCC4-type nuclease